MYYTRKARAREKKHTHALSVVQKRLFCKLYFAKLTKFAFFLIMIMFYSQKCIIFASNFKNGYKISINFLNIQTL